jgi:hypothetical protein
MNTTTRPWWNGPEISAGKNRLPVMVRWAEAESVGSTRLAASRCCSGFTPRTAANSDETGGRVPTWCAIPCGTPSRCRPPVSVLGRVLARPAIISEKNAPMDSAVPEFWNVDRIPDAAPRCRAGTLLMIEEELGAANMPPPIPFAAVAGRNPSTESRRAAASGR